MTSVVEDEFSFLVNIRRAVSSNLGMDGIYLIEALEDRINANPDSFTLDQAAEIAEDLANVSKVLYDFFKPVVGGIDGIIDLYLSNAKLSCCECGDIFYASDSGKSYLVTNEVVNMIGNENPEVLREDNNGNLNRPDSYFLRLMHLRELGKVEIYQISENRRLVVSGHEDFDELFDVSSNYGISPHRLHDIEIEEWESQGGLSAFYRVLPRREKFNVNNPTWVDDNGLPSDHYEQQQD